MILSYSYVLLTYIVYTNQKLLFQEIMQASLGGAEPSVELRSIDRQPLEKLHPGVQGDAKRGKFAKTHKVHSYRIKSCPFTAQAHVSPSPRSDSSSTIP